MVDRAFQIDPRSDSIGFLGLGELGSSMVDRLLHCGVTPMIYNRTREKADAFAGSEVRVAETPAQVASSVAVVITCLGYEADSAVYLGPDSITSVPLDDVIVINTSTIGPALANKLADAVLARGGSYLDCPVTNTKFGAVASGELTIPVGGSREVLDRARPVLELLASTIEHAGAIGTAQVVKLANNILFNVAAVSLAQALGLANAAGANLDVLRRLITRGSSRSHAMELYLDAMIDRDPKPRGAIRGGREVVGLGVDLAQSYGVDISIGTAARDVLQLAIERGLGDFDFAALMDLYESQEDATLD